MPKIPNFISPISHFFFFHIYLPIFLQSLKSYIWAISIFNVFFRTNSRKCFSEIKSSYHVVFRILIFNIFSPPLSLIMLFLTKSNKGKCWKIFGESHFPVSLGFHSMMWFGFAVSRHCEFSISWNSSCLHFSKDSWGKKSFLFMLNLFQKALVIYFLRHWHYKWN